MSNIVMNTTKDKLVITIDLTKEGTVSGSGKSMVIATTRGNAEVPGTDLKLGLNLFRKI